MFGCGPTCSCNKGQSGMGSIVSDITGAGGIAQAVGGVFSTIWGAKAQSDFQKNQIRAQMNLAKTQAQSALTQLQYQAALQAQQDAVDQSKAIRNAEIFGLVLVGGAAVLISLYFIRSATKKGN